MNRHTSDAPSPGIKGTSPEKKVFLSFFSLFFGFWLGACNPGSPASTCRPELPSLPPAWTGLLPEPRWRFEWIDQGGERRTLDAGKEIPALTFMEGCATPVLAFPHWPELDLPPALMKPAGAIFPFDVRGDRLYLSWRGGVDAWLYRELAAAGTEEAPLRRPELFDWPRFRELLEDPALPEEVRRDPWLVDWRALGRKTVQSGFDRRRIVAEPRKELVIPGFGGRWAGSSPFAEPVVQEEGGPLSVRVGSSVETFVSPGGILRCTADTWIWVPRNKF